MLSQESSPLSLPEILLHVYSYLDDSTLSTCARVSHFWRRWSLHHRSASAFVPSSDILDTFARRVVQDKGSDEEKEAEGEETKDTTIEGQEQSSGLLFNKPAAATTSQPLCLQELLQRGTEVRSLTIGDRWDGGKPRMRPDPFASHWSSVIPPRLTNLDHIGFRLYSPERFWADGHLRTLVMDDLVEQNPRIRSLEYSTYRAPGFSTLVDLLFQHPLQHLKRLDAQSRVTSEGFAELFVALILRDGGQVRQRRAASSVAAESLPNEPELQMEPQTEPEIEPQSDAESEPGSESGSESESDQEQEPTLYTLSDELLAQLQVQLQEEDEEGFAMQVATEYSEEEISPMEASRGLELQDQGRWLERQYNRLDVDTKKRLENFPSLDLEELIIRNIGPANATRHLFDMFLQHCYLENGIECEQSTLRRLTLLNFDLRHHLYNVRSQQRDPDVEDGELSVDRSILIHLCQRFPKLEQLCVSPDPSNIREPLSEPILDRIKHIYPVLDSGGHVLIPQSGEVGEDITLLCPNLKAIDFSHHREIPRRDWEILLKKLGPQLESVVAWDVDELGPRELLHLIPPSPAIIHTFGNDHRYQSWVGLQELDISANPKLGSAVPMFLKFVPTLRILRALGVPVNGSRLVGYDWVCTDLELLSINIFIPMATFKPKITWVWNLERDGWDVLPHPDDGHVNLSVLLTSEGEAITSLPTDEEEGLEDMDFEEEDQQEQGRVKSSHFDYSDSEDSDSEQEGVVGKAKEEDEAYLNWRAKEDKKIEETTAYSTQVQRQICQQLGRLVQLRELTLEGYKSDCDDKDEMFIDCLHLTLATGLDYLRPLRKNLKKLVVYQLDEELSGRAEVEWIAQNWVNYANGPWQEGYRNWKAAKGKPVQSPLEVIQEMPWGPSEDPLLPAAAFKELIGISVWGKEEGGARSENRANGNLAWLERQCPKLAVGKEDPSEPKVRTTFDPYYFVL
ncbi:hypothetical protein EC957_008411 [Mortierella hygrophila]|uniref:F-box domain-containing protein n=1 Tax=Mortierella hygrophila TaxID=979708 RepID=A0A9P6EXK4_9FUNG|nr:hypothetical protein EC957_008411 [Mortierella hygrophila]